MNRPLQWRSISGVQAGERPFRVGRATVDPLSRDVAWPDGEERLQPQTLKVLVTLASRSGEVVTRDELVQLCWDGRIIGEDVINRSISLLRHLADRVGGFTIETIPRTGYRLIERELPTSTIAKHRWIAASAAVILGLAGFAGWTWVDRQPESQGLPSTPSISVVPFIAETTDPLTRQVAQAAPASLEHMMAESGFAIVRDASDSLAARRSDYVFSGSVRRTSGSVEATVQLVSRRDGMIAFAHDFTAPIDRAADLPDRIGAAAAAELAWTGAQMILDQHHPLDPRIASELMQATNLIIEDHDSLRSYQMMRHVAALAPNSAIAQLGLAIDTGFSLNSIPVAQRADAVAIARNASDRALALAPEFGDVYTPRCLLHSPVRMMECDALLRKAQRIDPATSFVPGYLSAILYDAGRIYEAVELARVSLANDPYKPAKLARMIRMLEVSGSSGEADGVFNEASRLWPGGGRMRAARLMGMAEAGDYVGLARVADPRADANMIDPGPLRDLLAAKQKRDLRRAERTCGTDGQKPFTSFLCMTVLADLGDFDGSYGIAAKLYPVWQAPPATDEDRVWIDHPDGFQTAVLSAPAGKAMRADPRFLGLAVKLGLVAYWRAGHAPDFCTKAHEPVCGRIFR